MGFVPVLLLSLRAMAGTFTTSIPDGSPLQIAAQTVDPAGNTYVVGTRSPGVTGDIFIAKVDPTGAILFTKTYGGQGADTARAIALDRAGNIYVAGTTASAEFPLVQPLQTQISDTSGFILKLSNDANTILFSTFFGGTRGRTSLQSIATDSLGNLHVTGWSRAADFPQTTGLPHVALNGEGTSIQHGAILAKVSFSGGRILYSAVLSPLDSRAIDNTNAGGATIAVDALDRAYVAVNTYRESTASFVARVDSDGNDIEAVYSQSQTTFRAIALDAFESVYVASDRFFEPITASLTKLHPVGKSTLVPTRTVSLPPSCSATAQSLALAPNGKAWISGTLGQSCALPNMNSWSNGPEYLAEVDPATSALDFSALYPAGTIAQSIAFDGAGFVHAAGRNGFVSSVNPTAPSSTAIFVLQNGFGGMATSRISPAEVFSIYGPEIGPANPVIATPAGGFLPTTLGGVQATINGQKLPLLYVAAHQINAVVPMNLAVESAAVLKVTNGTTNSADYPVWIAAAAPVAATVVLNQDGTLNSNANPAKAGSVVTLFATGWHSNLAPLADGQIATAADNSVCATGCTATAQIPGLGIVIPPVNIPAIVEYAGPSPGTVAAVTQFNIRLNSTSIPLQPSPQGAILTITGQAGRSIRAAFSIVAQQ